MARFKSISLDYDDVMVGTTNGCSCCSNNVNLTVELIDDYIKSLQDDIKKAKQYREVLQKKEDLMKDLR